MQIQGIRRLGPSTNLPNTDLSIGRLFQSKSLFNAYPGLKRPTSQSDSTELAEVLRRGCLFGATCHDTRGAIALATATWANLFGRCTAIQPSTPSLTLLSTLCVLNPGKPAPCTNLWRGTACGSHGVASNALLGENRLAL
jgi:hypothetical protein